MISDTLLVYEFMTRGSLDNLLFRSKVFELEDLLRASAEVLGKGTFGTSYQAVWPVVAVKRLKDVTISEKEFKEKIELVGAMDHVNLVPLRAYYYSRDEKLLVHDYFPMGSLSALLHKTNQRICFLNVSYSYKKL
ncbi:probable inactive receptor kinase At1g48480 [Lotus japonicus]|uniref:probable inactive receptor kinase At1g48480 n=1 Tax=Lotus japonicus TaxID=34305 RepID=UPI00258C5066|nr:probable inactive receptor kinase At1g48480 [Lotus japonicus]XP_057445277.1 probable inactive receptor kinase At1g48480 [Lotus japonicus]